MHTSKWHFESQDTNFLVHVGFHIKGIPMQFVSCDNDEYTCAPLLINVGSPQSYQ